MGNQENSKVMDNKQSTYIQSLEASHIWEHMNRGKVLEKEYIGMIPMSLENIKIKKVMKHVNEQLKDDKLKVVSVKENKKQVTDAVINLKFSSNVRSGEKIMETLQGTISKMNFTLKNKEDELEKEKRSKEKEDLEKTIEFLEDEIKKRKQIKEDIEENASHDKWKSMNVDELRKDLYVNGFTMKEVDNKTGEITETQYVAYKRSSSKSRSGQCLFIHEALYDDMISWSRMGLEFDENKKIDLASLLAYESLVGSSIEKTITINPKNILIVDDVFSKFTTDGNEIKKDADTGFLNSFSGKVNINNNLFDGESLLDYAYFKDNKGFMLLRNHMFKSAAFNTNIQLFMKRHADNHGINYDTWTVKDMFNKDIKVTDIHMIITPSSLKALKFSKDIYGVKEKKHTKKQLNKLNSKMYTYWKSKVRTDGNMFGICKTEKSSKYDDMQLMSYQMINSIPFSGDEVKELVKFEEQYIEDLKDKDNKFIEYLDKNKNDMNSNKMWIDLYKINHEIVNTRLFRDFRKKTINKYVTHVKTGKARVKGDYGVLLGNGMELLFHSINKLNIDENNCISKSQKLALTENQMHTKMYTFGKSYVCFRNPHTSPSNVLVAENTYNEDINTYFNLTKNIVVVNAVEFPLQDFLNGCDYDSDTMAIFDDKTILDASDRVYGKYEVCVNGVESQKVVYELTKYNMAVIDCILSTSQRNIGKITNIGQQAMSKYWDTLKNNGEGADEILKSVDVMAILSGISIDMSKKLYAIDLKKEIRNIDNAKIYKSKKVARMTKDKETGEKIPKVDKKTGEILERDIQANPLFFKYVKESKTIGNRVVEYDTAMDYLFNKLSPERGNYRSNVDFNELLVSKEDEKVPNYSQMGGVISYINEMENKLKKTHVKKSDSEHAKTEKLNKMDDIYRYAEHYLLKKKVNPATIHTLLSNMSNSDNISEIKLLMLLHKTQGETFKNTFKSV